MPSVPRICSEPDCDRSHYAKGLCKRDYYREERKRNPEKQREYSKTYRDADPDRWRGIARASWRRAYEADPQKYIDRNAYWVRVRRARLAGAESEVYTVENVLDAHGTDCHLCGEPVNLLAPRKGGLAGWEFGLHLDHKMPLARGGTDLLVNVFPTHAICNLTKGSAALEFDGA